jgi:flagellar assembly protein FliH
MPSGTESRIEIFDYPPSAKPLPALWEELVEVSENLSDSSIASKTGCAGSDSQSIDLSIGVAEEKKRSFEAGREQGIREGRNTEALAQRELMREAREQGAKQAAHLADQFAVERDRFLQTAEHEVVKLALAIAARILRREAQTDPLFLVGAVRVALGQLAATLQVRVRVPPTDASLWAETLAHLPNLKGKPAVVPDESMHIGECCIETDMGSVDLGLPAQLHQIESGLFDGARSKVGEARAPSDEDRQEAQV